MIFISILLILHPASAAAVCFDATLASQINQNGIYEGEEGIIYAALAENDTVLIIISVKNNTFIINAFGTDGESADIITFDYKTKPRFKLFSYVSDEDFCITVSYNDANEHYRIINDAFTKSADEPSEYNEIASYSDGTLNIYPTSLSVYSFLNRLREEHISKLPSYVLSKIDTNQLLQLIKSCADIQNYDASSYDEDALMLSVLYTHRNFMLLTDLKPETRSAHSGIMLCQEDFISDAVYKAFRITAKHPPVNMLITLGYCANGSLYYYRGGYSKYFATDVKSITKSFYIGNETLYIIFNDVYIESGKEPLSEYSTATAVKDDDGWYLTSIHMNSDFSDLLYLESQQSQTQEFGLQSALIKYIPLFIMLFAAAAVGVTAYIFLIKR